MTKPHRNPVLRSLLALACSPLHPFLLGTGIALGIVNGLRHRYDIEEVWATLVVLTAATAAMILAFRPLLRGFRNAAVGTTLVLAWLWLQPAALIDLHIDISLWWAFAAASGVGGLVLAYHLRRVGPVSAIIPMTLNVIGAAILLPTLPGFLIWEGIVAPQRPQPRDIFPDLPTLTERGPDVWHLILDRYANGEALSRVYGFDNEPFLSALEARGFSVARDAAANYQFTSHSLASTLNADYLDALSTAPSLMRADWVPLYRAVSDNRITRLFLASGHTLYYHGSWWHPTRGHSLARENIGIRLFPALWQNLHANSMPYHLFRGSNIPYLSTRRDQCDRVLQAFRRLEDVARLPDRKFVFAHVLVPHPPYVMDRTGRCIDLSEAEQRSRRDNYVGQVEYANRRVLALIDVILSGPRPAVIILQSDEGPWPAELAGDERFIGSEWRAVDWGAATRDQLREKFRILYAIRSPDAEAFDLDTHPSPVNAYRLVLNRHFGAALPTLPDRSFVFYLANDLYRFHDVTDLVR